MLGVTIGRNVPFIDALDTFDLTGSTGEAVDGRRISYESSWNGWHYLRTAASIGSFALAASAAPVAANES